VICGASASSSATSRRESYTVAIMTGSFQLGPDAGRVVVKTGRAGVAARAGHDLTIEVTRWSARVEIPADDAGGVTAATIAAELDLGSLEVREGTGGVKPLTDGDRGQIKKTMAGILGDGTASFASSRITSAGAGAGTGAGGGGQVEGTLTIRGKAQPVRLQVSEPGPGRYAGTATVLQSAFGIKPYSGFFGALKLSDEVRVEFEVDLTRARPA
jgi:polyisoprenoid-binding protein YceI